MSTYVIADIGACHDGDPARMFEAIKVAERIGVNALKFQWVSDPERMAARRGRAAADGYADVYRKYLAWPPSLHAALVDACRASQLDYMCTVFLPKDVATVAPFVANFKVASFEAEDEGLLGSMSAYYQPVIVSLGMGASAAPARRHIDEDRLSFLRCVSSYPAPVDALHLALIRDRSCELAGLSDHTYDGHVGSYGATITGALAVAAGARIVEAHLRLDETARHNPDYRHAMPPGEFGMYVRAIRFAETCCGNGGNSVMLPCETAMARYRVGAPAGDAEVGI